MPASSPHPRPSRFHQPAATAGRAARIARLKDAAPTLTHRSRGTTTLALFASAIALLAFAGFYLTMQILDRAQSRPAALSTIEVDAAPQVLPSEAEQAVARIAADEAAAAAEYQQLLETLLATDPHAAPPADVHLDQ
jgi:hypothetical protein